MKNTVSIKGQIVSIKGMDRHYKRKNTEPTFLEVEIDSSKIGGPLVFSQTRSMFPKEPEIGDEVEVELKFRDIKD